MSKIKNLINIFWKELYFFSKDSSLFSLPILRKLRPKILKKHLNIKSSIKCGSRVTIKAAHPNPQSIFLIENGLAIGSDAYIDYTGGLKVGKNVTISERAILFTHDHNIDGKLDWRNEEIIKSPLFIDNYAWIGAMAIITNAVTYIGEGAIVAAGSVVTKNIPPNSVVAGVPAKIIRNRGKI